jgi:hypothetical protein
MKIIHNISFATSVSADLPSISKVSNYFYVSCKVSYLFRVFTSFTFLTLFSFSIVISFTTEKSSKLFIYFLLSGIIVLDLPMLALWFIT